MDLRQADLAFNNSERHRRRAGPGGRRCARRGCSGAAGHQPAQGALDQAQAEADAQRQVVQRLHSGNRPEEIAQARANVQSAEADAANAKLRDDRLKALDQTTAGRAVVQQDVDSADAALDVANAKVAVNQKALELELAGPRQEDIAQAEADLAADEAQVALLRRELADADLVAPQDGVIRSRLMEPGEMASPQTPVFSVAIVDPKWVRAYVSEPDLGKVHPGDAVSISVDSFPDRKFDGWVGFISPVAEFTPKTVQTDELRTSLVYEVRVFVKDPSDDLRLGMPATVRLQSQNGSVGETESRR